MKRFITTSILLVTAGFIGAWAGLITVSGVDTSQTKVTNFAVAPAFRGKGIGTKVLESTCRSACEELGVKRLIGVVLESNAPSAQAFIKADFKKLKTGHQVRHRSCSVFEWICNGET